MYLRGKNRAVAPFVGWREIMVERAPFLNAAYSAYHHRERPAEDHELTRVGPGEPCGEYLRRFWQPVVLASELGELPRRLRILGIARIAAPRSNSV
jgi:hypothetical protein